MSKHLLAWCNGNIHLFRESSDLEAWLPETSIIYSPKNGETITNFLLKANPQIKKAWLQSTPSLGFIRNTGSQKLREDIGSLPILGTKIRGHKLEVDKLASRDATGFLAGEICNYVGDVNDQPHEVLYKTEKMLEVSYLRDE